MFAVTLLPRQKLQDKSQQKLAQFDNTFIKLHVPGRRNKGNKATHMHQMAEKTIRLLRAKYPIIID